MRDERKTPRARQRRQQVAAEAARIIMEHGALDARSARRKAAHRLGIDNQHDLPDADEIDSALCERQRLFGGHGRSQQVQALRESAVEAMLFLLRYDPRLVGPVLEGSADEHTVVTLHVHCDDPSELQRFLDEHSIPCESASRRVRLDRDRDFNAIVYRFIADGDPFELLVLPTSAARQAPLDPLDASRVQHRSTLSATRALL